MGLDVFPLDQAKALLRWTAASADIFGPLKSAAGGIVWLIAYLEEVQAVQREYRELESLLREFLEILIAAGRQRRGGFVPIRGLDSAAGAPDHGESDAESSVASLDEKHGLGLTPVRLSKAVKAAIQAIDCILADIRKLFERKKKNGKVQKKRSLWARIFYKDRDRSKLRSLDRRLRNALEMFKVYPAGLAAETSLPQTDRLPQTRGQISQERAMRKSAKQMKQIVAHMKAQAAALANPPDQNVPVATVPAAKALPPDPVPADVVVQTATVTTSDPIPADLLAKPKILPVPEIMHALQGLRDAELQRVETNNNIISRLDDIKTRILVLEDNSARVEALEGRIVEGESARRQELDAWKKTLRFIHDEHHAWERRRQTELQKLPRQIAEQLIDRLSNTRNVPIEGPDDSEFAIRASPASSPSAYLSQQPDSPPQPRRSLAPSSAPSWTLP